MVWQKYVEDAARRYISDVAVRDLVLAEINGGRSLGGHGHTPRRLTFRAIREQRPGPKLRALYVERRDLERRVEALRLLKDSMDPARYTSELEKLVTDMALKSREIRAIEGAPQ